MNNSLTDELRKRAMNQLGAMALASPFSTSPMGDYIGHLEALRDGLQREVAELREALGRTAIFAEFGGPRGILRVVAFRCRLCASGAIPGEPIPHADECPLSECHAQGNIQ